jgi:hypothetical protein
MGCSRGIKRMGAYQPEARALIVLIDSPHY